MAWLEPPPMNANFTPFQRLNADWALHMLAICSRSLRRKTGSLEAPRRTGVAGVIGVIVCFVWPLVEEGFIAVASGAIATSETLGRCVPSCISSPSDGDGSNKRCIRGSKGRDNNLIVETGMVLFLPSLLHPLTKYKERKNKPRKTFSSPSFGRPSFFLHC